MADSKDVVKDLESEKQHFLDVFKAFAFYKVHGLRRIERAACCIASLPPHHLAMLQPAIGERQAQLRAAIDRNDVFMREMLLSSRDMFANSSVSQQAPVDMCDCSDAGGESPARGHSTPPAPAGTESSGPEPSAFTMEKVATTLKQFYRDWSKEGEPERRACYLPIIEELKKCCPISSDEYIVPPRVLVPGAGLGRLVFEIAQQGYECQGNEWSMHMLIASNFIINRPLESPPLTIYPWMLNFCNHMATADQLQSVVVPDIAPALVVGPDANLSMSAGNFLEVYTEADQWDCVVTCFFVDTAHNPLAYIECIRNILVPGGVWINLGPLLWHWADANNEMSVELSYEDLRSVIQDKFHFNILTEKADVRSGYIQNPRSMMKTVYDSVMFVAQKPDNESDAAGPPTST